jgi:hypothetical protein
MKSATESAALGRIAAGTGGGARRARSAARSTVPRAPRDEVAPAGRLDVLDPVDRRPYVSAITQPSPWRKTLTGVS